MRPSTVQVGAQSWHVVESGPADASSAIVLAAGFPQSWYAWRHVIPLLSRSYRVIAIDLPGQGDSDPSNVGYDSWTIAGLVGELIDELGIVRPIFAGHDVGAWVGFAASARLADKLAGVALLDANIAGINLNLDDRGGYGGWHFIFQRVPELPVILFPGHERDIVTWFLQCSALDWRATFTDADIDEFVRAYSRPTSLRGMVEYYRAVPGNAVRNREIAHAGIGLPLLAIAGAQSGSHELPEKLVPIAHDLMAVTIDDAAHYVAEERPDQVATALNIFAREVFDGRG